MPHFVIDCSENIIKIKSPKELAKSIIYLIENRDLANQYGQAARKKVLKDYSISRMFEETYELYVI